MLRQSSIVFNQKNLSENDNVVIILNLGEVHFFHTTMKELKWNESKHLMCLPESRKTAWFDIPWIFTQNLPQFCLNFAQITYLGFSFPPLLPPPPPSHTPMTQSAKALWVLKDANVSFYCSAFSVWRWWHWTFGCPWGWGSRWSSDRWLEHNWRLRRHRI